jgi:hypothetical protein
VRVLPALVLALLGAQGCAGGLSCTDVGGSNQLTVTIPRSLYLAAESAEVQVCDDEGCVSTSEDLPRQDRKAGSHGIGVGWAAFGRRPAPGHVHVTVTLADAKGKVVAVARHDVELTLRFPNGKKCDGDGYLSGQLNMRSRDRV